MAVADSELTINYKLWGQRDVNAWNKMFDLVQSALTGSLADDRTAIRDAIANVKGYEGLASGPISFCAAATPQCRDGNRTAVLIGYTKGGEDFETEVLARVTMEEDFGLE